MPEFEVVVVGVAVLEQSFYLSLLFVESLRFQGALLHIEFDMGLWKFDLFWLRGFYRRLYD